MVGRRDHLHHGLCAVVARIAVVGGGQRPQRVAADYGMPPIQAGSDYRLIEWGVLVLHVVGDRDDRPEVGLAVPAVCEHLPRFARHHGVRAGIGQVGDQQPFADDKVPLCGVVGDLNDFDHADVIVELLR